MLGALPLSVTDYLEAHQVPLVARPRWIRLLVAMESAYRVFLNERTADRPNEPEVPDAGS